MQDLSFLWKVPSETVRAEVYGSWTLRIWLSLPPVLEGEQNPGKSIQFVNPAIAVETTAQPLLLVRLRLAPLASKWFRFTKSFYDHGYQQSRQEE